MVKKAISLLPIDVVFDMKAQGTCVQLPEADLLTVYAEDKPGHKITILGTQEDAAGILRSYGYVVRSAPGHRG